MRFLNPSRTYEDIHSAYLGSLEDVLLAPDYVSSPRGMRCLEKVNYMFTIANPVHEPIRTLDLARNTVIAEYTSKEEALYNSCSIRVEDFIKASKFWEKVANVDGTINSAYGFLIWKNRSQGNVKFDNTMRTPWEWAKKSLTEDRDTRQAILRFSLPEHSFDGNRDFPCTIAGNFHIRNNKLNLTIVMRSNDLWLGLTYDLPWFVSLIDRMVEELQPVYPDLVGGSYTHIAHSLHIYERDLDKVRMALGRPAEAGRADE